MLFEVDVSKFGHMSNPLEVFWPGPVKWYQYPKAGFRGRKGRFLIGFNLFRWIIRARVTWTPH